MTKTQTLDTWQRLKQPYRNTEIRETPRNRNTHEESHRPNCHTQADTHKQTDISTFKNTHNNRQTQSRRKVIIYYNRTYVSRNSTSVVWVKVNESIPHSICTCTCVGEFNSCVCVCLSVCLYGFVSLCVWCCGCVCNWMWICVCESMSVGVCVWVWVCECVCMWLSVWECMYSLV